MEHYPESVLNVIYQNIKNKVNTQLESIEAKHHDDLEKLAKLKSLKITTLEPSLIKNPRIWKFAIPSHQFDFLRHNYVNFEHEENKLVAYIIGQTTETKWFLIKNGVSIRNFYPKTLLLGVVSILGLGSKYFYDKNTQKKEQIKSEAWDEYLRGKKDVTDDITQNKISYYDLKYEYMPLIYFLHEQKIQKKKSENDKLVFARNKENFDKFLNTFKDYSS